MNDFIFSIKDLLMPIVFRFRLVLFRRKWRRKNSHNQTRPNNVFPIEKVTVGRYTYGEINIKTYGNQQSKLSIGNFCSIAGEVVFVLDGEHNYKRFSSYPFPSKVFHVKNDSICKGPIIVEDDVWIGYRATILSGSRLGQGCVIGAGSLVAGNIPPYSIYVNGRVVKYRFSNEIIESLMKVNFSKISYNILERIRKYCMNDLNDDDIEDLLEIIEDNSNEN